METGQHIQIQEHEPLAPHTSWRIGGAARFFVETRTGAELQAALRWCSRHTLPVLILGGGTNVLICDEGFDGLVVRCRGTTWRVTQHNGTNLLYAEAGVPIGRLAWAAGSQGWGGLEWAAGLPGTLGGAVYGNAGCYGGDIASIFHRVWVVSEGEIQEWKAEHMGYGYRTSTLKQRQGTPPITDVVHPSLLPPVILAAELRVGQHDQTTLVQRMRQIAAERKAKTPVGHSCGSVFKNPPGGGATAGQLIDQAGLKGTRVGAAEISHQHANYIINLGGASSDDVLRLIDLAQTTVFRQTGLVLEPEIRIIGNRKRDTKH